jgi:hypothetical protein
MTGSNDHPPHAREIPTISRTPSPSTPRRLAGIIALLAITVLLFFWGADKQFSRNSDMDRTDQSAYMELAKRSASTPFGYVASRNYMPIYPQIMAWFYSGGMSKDEFFRAGKRVNTVIAFLVALAVYALFLRRNNPWDAAVAASACALSMIAFKAPCFQPEVLFYGVGLMMIVAHVRLILRPSWQKALLAGILSGVAYLTKASVPPLIALTVLCLIGRWVERRWKRRPKAPQTEKAPGRRLRAGEPMVIAVFLVSLLISVFPYLRANKEMYGRWICENNSYFFFCDSWEECVNLMKSVGGEAGLYRLPRSELPGPLNYWRTHSLGDIFGRIGTGLERLYSEHIRWGYGYAKFLTVYGLCFALVGFQHRRRVRDWLAAGANKWAALYFITFFCGYLLLCAWYTQIDASKRFALIMFLPAMYLFVRGLKTMRDADITWDLFGARLKSSAISAIALLFLIVYVLFDFLYRIQVMDGTY